MNTIDFYNKSCYNFNGQAVFFESRGHFVNKDRLGRFVNNPYTLLVSFIFTIVMRLSEVIQWCKDNK